jgi:hypothetical protein
MDLDSDLDADPDPAIFVSDLQDDNKKNSGFLSFLAYYFLKVNLHHFSKIKKVIKRHKTVGINVFHTIFA